MLKLSDTLKSKLKDTVDMPINHDRTKDKSPTPSLKNSPKVQKKHPISPLDDRSFNNKESNHENDTLPSKQINTKIIYRIRVTYLNVQKIISLCMEKMFWHHFQVNLRVIFNISYIHSIIITIVLYKVEKKININIIICKYIVKTS